MLVISGNALEQLGNAGSGVFGQGLVSISISNFDSFAFDWNANWVISAVFLRTSGGGELFDYDPPVMSDSDLFAGDEITHLTFCYVPPQPTPTPTATTTPTPTATNPPTPTPTNPPTATPTNPPTATPTNPPTNPPTPTQPPTSTVLRSSETGSSGGLLLALLVISGAAASLVLGAGRRPMRVLASAAGGLGNGLGSAWSTGRPSAAGAQRHRASAPEPWSSPPRRRRH
jgi:hypothetical protein